MIYIEIGITLFFLLAPLAYVIISDTIYICRL